MYGYGHGCSQLRLEDRLRVLHELTQQRTRIGRVDDVLTGRLRRAEGGREVLQTLLDLRLFRLRIVAVSISRR